jgi:hypothetical protein
LESGIYDGACRMPGLMMPYAIFHALCGPDHAKVLMIFFQVIIDVIACLALYSIVINLTKNRAWATWSFALYCCSSFVSIWNNHAISDSLSVGAIIFTFWALTAYKVSSQLKWLLLASFMMAWAIFIRPISAIAAISFSFVLMNWKFEAFNWKQLRLSIGVLALFASFTIIGVSGWTWRNLVVFDRFIPSQDKIENCYSSYKREKLIVRKLVMSWGCDFQEWTTNSEMEWFIEKPMDAPFHFDQRLLSSAYNSDSLKVLKALYMESTHPLIKSSDVSTRVANRMDAMVERYIHQYKVEHPVDFYVLNHFRFLRLFLFPGRIENLPFPKLTEMRFYHKAIKGGYLIFFHLITLLACVTMMMWFRRQNRQWWPLAIFPLLYIGIMGFYFGYVEQRYLVIAYPFMVILAAFPIQIAVQKIKGLRGQ